MRCLNSFLTSNELRTSHLCLLIISTQFSQNYFHQKASRLAQHSQYNDPQQEITFTQFFTIQTTHSGNRFK